MNCPYQNNFFCNALSSQTLSQLCSHCTHKKFAQGQQLNENYFTRKMILDGMITKMALDPITQKMTTSDIGRGDVYSAVRYVVKFCRDHGIPPLTHEQIAMVCSRSRPTVTSTLHQLIKKEPELFLPLSEGEKEKKDRL